MFWQATKSWSEIWKKFRKFESRECHEMKFPTETKLKQSLRILSTSQLLWLSNCCYDYILKFKYGESVRFELPVFPWELKLSKLSRRGMRSEETKEEGDHQLILSLTLHFSLASISLMLLVIFENKSCGCMEWLGLTCYAGSAIVLRRRIIRPPLVAWTSLKRRKKVEKLLERKA